MEISVKTKKFILSGVSQKDGPLREFMCVSVLSPFTVWMWPIKLDLLQKGGLSVKRFGIWNKRFVSVKTFCILKKKSVPLLKKPKQKHFVPLLRNVWNVTLAYEPWSLNKFFCFFSLCSTAGTSQSNAWQTKKTVLHSTPRRWDAISEQIRISWN